jgi:hypothetical protein
MVMTGTAKRYRLGGPWARIGRGLSLAALACLAQVAIGPPAQAQIEDVVRVYAHDASNGHEDSVVRFSRKLIPLGATSVKGQGGILAYGTPLAVDGQGRTWIAFDPLNTTKLLRMDNDGVLLPHALLANNPVNVVVDVDGRAFASTRIGLSSPGPAYGVDSSGNVMWSSSSGSSSFFNYPSQLAVTTTGELWLGGWTLVGGVATPLMSRVDTGSGTSTGGMLLDSVDGGICSLAPAPDGTLWALACGAGHWLFRTQGTSVLSSFPVEGGYSGVVYRVHIDAQGRPYVLSLYNEAGGWGSKLLRYNPAAPQQPEAAFQLGGIIRGWAFGPTGEDVFAIVTPSLNFRLERMNLISGAKSSIPLDPLWTDPYLPGNDPTGFVYANVIDRTRDNDGDGVPNGAETAACSNPFDAQSRPEGPKVYLSFAPTTNAIVLTFVDPDGLLDPAGGLDLSTLALLTGAGTNVFSFILPFLTAVDVSPDGTQATATFGALPLPSNLKIRLEARVSDLTGAVGWDWQVTPPGDL